MRVLLAALAVTTVMALSGCNEGTPGGPGVSNNTDNAADKTTSDDKTSADASTDVAPVDSQTNTTGETPGTAATTNSDAPRENPKDDGVGDPNNTFRLDMPNLTTSLKQGESKVISVGITREDNFDEDVTVEFQDLPKGVTIEPAKPMIKAGDKEAQITIKAANDAALDDHTIKVIGKPTKGANATNELNISIEKP